MEYCFIHKDSSLVSIKIRANYWRADKQGESKKVFDSVRDEDIITFTIKVKCNFAKVFINKKSFSEGGSRQFILGKQRT